MALPTSGLTYIAVQLGHFGHSAHSDASRLLRSNRSLETFQMIVVSPLSLPFFLEVKVNLYCSKR